MERLSLTLIFILVLVLCTLAATMTLQAFHLPDVIVLTHALSTSVDLIADALGPSPQPDIPLPLVSELTPLF